MNSAEFVYTVLLRPRPLSLAHHVLRAIIPSELNRHGARICLNPRDPVVSGALTLNVYEHAETRFFLKMCKPGMTFLDVGANIGYYTALAMSRMGSTGRIVALEPDPENFSFLERTVAANKRAENGIAIDCVRKAASDHEGVMTLFTSSQNRGDNRLYGNELADATCEVAVTTVDAILDDLRVPQVDFIKMDVQGYEGHVVEGMRRCLQQTCPLTVLSEFWPEGLRKAGSDPIRLLKSFGDSGFTLHHLRDDGELSPIADHHEFASRYSGRQYTNVVAVKQSSGCR